MNGIRAEFGRVGSALRPPVTALEASCDRDAAPAPATAGTGAIRHVADPVDLLCIFEPEVQVVCMGRAPNRDIERSLDALARAGKLQGGMRTTLPADKPLALDALSGLPASGVLATDIAFLVNLYTDLVGCPAVGLRCEITPEAMCPRFHVDRVGIRLLCTYRGPATEWLDDAWADRSRLGPAACGLPDETSGLMRDPTRVGRADTFDLVLLKGAAWVGNGARGAIHRSPGVPAHMAPRVLISIDALWP